MLYRLKINFPVSLLYIYFLISLKNPNIVRYCLKFTNLVFLGEK